jgi:hypothetical protein
LETLQLIVHPAHLPARVNTVAARVLSHDANWCVLRWKVDGAADLVVPAFAGRARTDGLWQTTCFELFVAPLAQLPHTAPAQDERDGREGQGEGYAEFNFSPSERWAAYDFTGYRAGMADRAMPAPVITPRRGGDVLICDVAIPTAALPPLPWRYGLTAVLEEAGAVKSFWALAHPRQAPDFHDPACLAATLAAPNAV